MKVLLVDDAAFVRMSLKKILDDSPYDFTYYEAGTGAEALKSYQAYHPDLVIMDITMPEVDGIQAVREIKAVDKDAKIIMCSALGYQDKVVEAVAAGALDFIVKPYEASKVIKTIEAIMKL
ncbi:MAG: response regulator [Butyribacter sp.]|nr:response regulator [bacterium]MDY3853911.1 response regulator [Butyribacter sp.]